MEHNNLNQSINISGITNIIADDDLDLDLQDIENSLINGIQTKKKVAPEDTSKGFDDYINKLSNDFKLPDEKTEQVDSKRTDDDEEEDDNAEGEDSPLNTWSPSNPEDSQLSSMTNEDRKQRHINKVLGNMDRVDDDSGFVNQEEEDDEVARNLEQIDLLRTNLMNEGIDLERVPEVQHSSSRKEIKAVLRILQIKNDRLRYCDMFEEVILSMAYGLEGVFDGKKEYFGSKIDLVGWPQSVKVKLHRMRYNTSSFVGDIMKGYNVGHGWRILLELLPSLFLYSRNRVQNTNDLISDDKFHDTLIALQK
jgi:hypothetical protein